MGPFTCSVYESQDTFSNMAVPIVLSVGWCIGLINLNAYYVTESERLQSRIYGLSIVRIHWNTLEGIQRMNRTVRTRLPTRTAVVV